jgi:hypothetical protein
MLDLELTLFQFCQMFLKLVYFFKRRFIGKFLAKHVSRIPLCSETDNLVRHDTIQSAVVAL